MTELATAPNSQAHNPARFEHLPAVNPSAHSEVLTLTEMEALTVGDQALLLHQEIFGQENGVPDVELFTAAQEFAGHVHYDPNARTVNDHGEEVRGVYYGADGEQLDGAIVEDILHVANPETWVQDNSHRHVLERARTLLQTEGDLGADSATLELAHAISGRQAQNADLIDDLALQRMLDLDQEARAQLEHQRGGKQRVQEAAQRNAQDIAHTHYTPIDFGSARVGRPAVDSKQPGANERLVRLDEVAASEPVSRGEATVTTAYAENTFDQMTDTEILSELIANDAVRSADDIARILYPEKTIGGSARHGKVKWRNLVGIGWNEMQNYKSKDALTPAERAEVEGFARQVAVARRHEAAVPEEFKRQHPLPTHQQLAHELFPNVDKVEHLSREQWAIVRQSMARLREIRLEQVHPDRFGRLRNAVMEVREKGPGIWQDLKSKASAVAEKLSPEAIKQRVGRAVGAVALAGVMFVENKPWERVIPDLKEAISMINPRELALEIGVRLQNLAAEAGGRLRTYLGERLEAMKQMDTERKLKLGAMVAAVGAVSAVAVRGYLEYRHGIDTRSGVNSGDAISAGVPDIDTGHAGSNTAANPLEGVDATPDTLEPSPSSTDLGKTDQNMNPTVEVGSYDGSKRLQGYPKGSVGYRVVEHAEANGFDIKTRAQADRLIDATLKMDGIGWNEEVGSKQNIKLLSKAQMTSILRG